MRCSIYGPRYQPICVLCMRYSNTSVYFYAPIIFFFFQPPFPSLPFPPSAQILGLELRSPNRVPGAAAVAAAAAAGSSASNSNGVAVKTEGANKDGEDSTAIADSPPRPPPPPSPSPSPAPKRPAAPPEAPVSVSCWLLA